MLALLILLATADGKAAHFLKDCDREPMTRTCAAYMTGFLDSALAHRYASSQGLQVRKGGVTVTSTCLPDGLSTDVARKVAVSAMKQRKPGDPPYLTILYALAKEYPCK